jgi:WD40 repeat protein
MYKQEAIKRIFLEYISTQYAEPLTKHGFKYVKTKNAFKKAVGEFEYWVGFGHVSNPLHFDEPNERLQFFYTLGANMHLPKYEKWFQQTFEKNFSAYLYEKLPRVKAWFPVLFNQFESTDFYEPTNSQKFKMYISGTLAGNNEPDALNFEDALRELEAAVLPFFDQFKTWDDALDKDLYIPFQKSEFLLYAGKKDEYRQSCIAWRNKLLDSIEKFKDSDATQLRFSQEGLQELSRKYKLVFKQELMADLDYEKVSYKKTVPADGFSFTAGWEYEGVLTIDNISPEIYNYEIDSHNRRLIIGHQARLASLWDFEGNKLGEEEIPYGGWASNAKVGYVQGLDCYYINSFLYDKQFNKTIGLTDLGLHGGRDAIDFYPTIFDDRLLIASQKETAFYDKSGKLLRKEQNKYGKLVAMLPHTKRLLYYDGENYHLTDKDINLILSLESNKSNWDSSTAVSANEKYLFAGGYYTKSYFYDLTKGTRQVLWAHETFKEGYKDKYNVSHNFGVKHAKFSPDNSRLVVGADHARHVVWEIPSLKRIELQPEYEFTFEGAPPQTEFANDIRQIDFLDNGKLFCTVIRGHAIGWNKQLQQLGKTSNVWAITYSGDEQYAVIKHDAKSLSLYKRK